MENKEKPNKPLHLEGPKMPMHLEGIATLSHDPLATYHLAGRKPTKHKGSRK